MQDTEIFVVVNVFFIIRTKFMLFSAMNYIRIYHDCEGVIEKSAEGHRLASRGYIAEW